MSIERRMNELLAAVAACTGAISVLAAFPAAPWWLVLTGAAAVGAAWRVHDKALGALSTGEARPHLAARAVPICAAAASAAFWVFVSSVPERRSGWLWFGHGAPYVPYRGVAAIGTTGVGFLAASLVPISIRMARRLPALSQRSRRAWILTWGLAVFLPVAFWSTVSFPWNGDEPHYLLSAATLWSDATFDLRAAYAERRWTAFYPAVAPFFPPSAEVVSWIGSHAYLGDHGEHFPVHGIGMTLLLAAPVGLAGPWAVPVLGVMLGCVLLWQVFRVAHGSGASCGAAFAAAVVCVLSPPILYTFSRPSVDATGALAAAVALAAIRPAGAVARGQAAGCAAVALLPWLHFRFAPLAGWLAWIAARSGQTRWRKWAYSASLVVGAAGLAVFCRVALGFWSPHEVYGRTMLGDAVPQSIHESWDPIGVVAALLDGATGWFVICPVAAIGAAALSRRPASEAVGLLLILAAPVAANLWMHDKWVRMYAAAAPLLAAPVAFVFDRLRPGAARAACWILAGATVAQSAVLCAIPALRNADPTLTVLLRRAGQRAGVPLERLLPDFRQPSPVTWIAAALAAVAFAWLVYKVRIGTRDGAAGEA